MKTTRKTTYTASSFSGSLLAIFLWFSIYGIAKNITSIFLASILSPCRAIHDYLSMNAAESAETTATTEAERKLDQRLAQAHPVKRVLARSLYGFNSFAFNIYNFNICVSDVVTFWFLTRRKILSCILGIISAILGVICYNMLLRLRLKKHSYDLVLCNKKELLRSLGASPRKLLEFFILVLSTYAYRLFVAGLISSSELSEILDIGLIEKIHFYGVVGSTAVALYCSIFLRTEHVYDKLFEQQNLSLAEWKKRDMLFDGLLAASRAAPVATIIYRHSPLNRWLILALGFVGGATVFSYELYRRATQHYSQPPVQNIPQAGDQNDAIKLFEVIKQRFDTKIVKIVSGILNSSTRIANGFLFYSALKIVNELLKIHKHWSLDEIDLFCALLLWYGPTAENDFILYQEILVENIKLILTKMFLEPKNKLWAFWHSKLDYPIELLQERAGLLSSTPA